LVYSTEKLIKENREKLPVKIVNEIEENLEACKKAIKDGPIDEIKKTTENLVKASHKMSEEMYKSASAGEPKGDASGETEAPKKNEDAVDAEFEEAKE